MHDSQLSITKKEDTTLLDLLRFVDSRTSFAEDSASDSHHLSSSDKGSGDRVCNVSTDAVKWETFEEDMGIKEEIRSISSKFIDLTFQPQWNHKLRAQASLLGDGEILVERMSDSTETDADRLVEPLNNKEHVCETNLMSENTQEFDLGELKRQDIMGEKRGLLLEKSPYTGDSICDSKFYDLKLEAFQPLAEPQGRYGVSKRELL